MKKSITTLCAAVAICAAGTAYAETDPLMDLNDCLSHYNKALHLRHRECFARELKKLSQHTREEHGERIRIMTETAAVLDKNDAKDDADARTRRQRKDFDGATSAHVHWDCLSCAQLQPARE